MHDYAVIFRYPRHWTPQQRRRFEQWLGKVTLRFRGVRRADHADVPEGTMLAPLLKHLASTASETSASPTTRG